MNVIKTLMISSLILAMLPAGSVFAQSRGIALESKPVVQSTPFVDGVYRALVIGNDSYSDPERRWPSLETAVSDARAVGNLLRSTPGMPWWRVVTSTGRLVPKHENEHAERLRAEGVKVENGRVVG